MEKNGKKLYFEAERRDLSESINKLTSSIIQKIYKENFKEVINLSLSENEVGMLYRWSIYVSLNTFVDRFYRTANNEFKISNNNNNNNYQSFYYLNSMQVGVDYYNNDILNEQLVCEIRSIFNNQKYIINKTNIIKLNKNKNKFFNRNYSFEGLKNLMNRVLVNLKFNMSHKNEYVFENSRWLNAIFDIKFSVPNFEYNYSKINELSRDKLKNIFYNEFLIFLNLPIFNKLSLNSVKKNNLSNLFADWANRGIPISILKI